MKMPESKLVRYYRRNGTDQKGRSLRDIRALSLQQLEETHDFIQWLFPLPEQSSANPDAPLLSEADIQQFVADNELRLELLQSLKVVLRFFGFAVGGSSESPRISRADDFSTRQAIWLHPFNHNFFRISRILRSLTLLGCHAYAAAILECLEGVYAESRGKIGPKTIQYWRNAVDRGDGAG